MIGKRKFLFTSDVWQVALIVTALFFTSCAGIGRQPIQRNSHKDPSAGSQVDRNAWSKSVVRAPWETWSEDGEPEPFSYATQSFLSGKAEKAMQILRGVEEENSQLAEQALARRLSVLLKLGRSREVLQGLSEYAGTTKRSLDELGPQLSLIAAFAYQHSGDPDQTLAWLGLTYRTSTDRITGRLLPPGERANDELTRLVQRIRPETFESYSARWGQDPYLNRVFSTERLRRVRGGLLSSGESPQWFRPETYLAGQGVTDSPTSHHEQPSIPEHSPQKRVIGVLLPLTSPYASHAQQVQRGLELAFGQAENPELFQLVVENAPGDEMADEQALQRLITSQHAELIFGPLLVKSAQLVSNLSRQHQVPFVTFTKKKGITSGSPYAARLGATAEAQVGEASEFLLKVAGKRTLMILSSQNAEPEFQEEFPEIFRRAGGTVIAEGRYESSKQESVAATIAQIERLAPEALFFSGTIEESLPVLEGLQRSPFSGILKLGSATWDDPVQARSYAPALEGALYVTPFFLGSDRPVVRAFAKSFRERFSTEPDLLAAQAFDAVSFVLRASGNTPLTPQGFRKKLAAAGTHEGITGLLSVQDNGEFRRRISVVQIRSGVGLKLFQLTSDWSI